MSFYDQTHHDVAPSSASAFYSLQCCDELFSWLKSNQVNCRHEQMEELSDKAVFEFRDFAWLRVIYEFLRNIW